MQEIPKSFTLKVLLFPILFFVLRFWSAFWLCFVVVLLLDSLKISLSVNNFFAPDYIHQSMLRWGCPESVQVASSTQAAESIEASLASG